MHDSPRYSDSSPHSTGVDGSADDARGSDVSTKQQEPAVVPQLVSIERRVLGALMEKQLTTPDQYPLTLNSLITACNQKSSRDPVSNYAQGEVARTLQQLQHAKFVSKEYGSRAEKYAQNFINALGLGKKHQSVLCVMMLRGPQTVSELLTRTQRMVEFAGKEDLEHTLDRLCQREVPFVVKLQPQPGQRGERFMHLFSGVPDNVASNSDSVASVQPSTSTQQTTETSHALSNDASSASKGSQANTDVSELLLHIELLQEQVDELKARCSALEDNTQRSDG